jgi:hypothetical protein
LIKVSKSKAKIITIRYSSESSMAETSPLIGQFKTNLTKLSALKRELAAKSATLPKQLQLDINKNVKEYESTLAAIRSYLKSQGVDDDGLGFFGFDDAAILAIVGGVALVSAAGSYIAYRWGKNTETMAPVLLKQAQVQEKQMDNDRLRLEKLGALTIIPDAFEAAGKSAGGMGLLIIAGLAAYLLLSRR